VKTFLFKVKLVAILLSPLMFITCTGNNTAWQKAEEPVGAFFDYKIRGEEGDSNVTVYIQYKYGPNGDAYLLNDPANVQLDGEMIAAGNGKLAGSFYEIQKPAYSFAGKHIITYTDENKKEHKQEFEYKPFSLQTELPGVVDRGDLVIEFEDLDDKDAIHVSATDTSFTSSDIIEIDTVKNGKLVITADKLRNLVNGPVTLLLSKETEKVIKNSINEHGRITVSYGLKRQFELESPDAP
jgi:hypothetical protein